MARRALSGGLAALIALGSLTVALPGEASAAALAPPRPGVALILIEDRVSFDELIRTELAAHGAEPDQDARVHLSGVTGVRLRSSTVQTLALLVQAASLGASLSLAGLDRLSRA